MQTDEMRERMFTMRLSKEESERLDSLASHYGLNGVGVIRMLLKREADQVENSRRISTDTERESVRRSSVNAMVQIARKRGQAAKDEAARFEVEQRQRDDAARGRRSEQEATRRESIEGMTPARSAKKPAK